MRSSFPKRGHLYQVS